MIEYLSADCAGIGKCSQISIPGTLVVTGLIGKDTSLGNDLLYDIQRVDSISFLEMAKLRAQPEAAFDPNSTLFCKAASARHAQIAWSLPDIPEPNKITFNAIGFVTFSEHRCGCVHLQSAGRQYLCAFHISGEPC